MRDLTLIHVYWGQTCPFISTRFLHDIREKKLSHLQPIKKGIKTQEQQAAKRDRESSKEEKGILDIIL
jgi:hypothetical protein